MQRKATNINYFITNTDTNHAELYVVMPPENGPNKGRRNLYIGNITEDDSGKFWSLNVRAMVYTNMTIWRNIANTVIPPTIDNTAMVTVLVAPTKNELISTIRLALDHA